MTASEKVTFTMTFGPRRLGLPASENGFQPSRKSFFVVVTVSDGMTVLFITCSYIAD